MKWARTTSAKHDRLPAGFIDHAVPLQAPRNADRLAFGRVGRDKFWIRSWREALRAWNGVGRNQLHDAQSIFAIRDQCELRRTNTSDLDCMCIVQRSAC